MVRIFLFSILLSLFGCSKSLSKEEITKYTILGDEIVHVTTKNLGVLLMEKMKEGGVKKAVPFCNAMAYPLTEQMTEMYNVEIKRTSHKLRNEKNMPNTEEIKIINLYQKSKEEGEQLEPILEKDSFGNVHFYSPIIAQKKCLTCHGSIGKEVSNETDSLIKSYYKDDMAMGFKEGDLRGIWSLTFKN